MKTLWMVICVSFALAGFASQPADGGRTAPASEATKVRSLLLYQQSLFNQARWRPLWRTYSPRLRSRCTYTRFVAEMKAMRTAVGRVATRNIAVSVRGLRAFVAYQIFARGRLIGAMTAKEPDIYVRIGGRWFDDVDAGSPC